MAITIYIPIWIDQFGIKNKKMFLMSVLQISIPLGKVSGFFLNMLYGHDKVSYIYVYIIIYVYICIVATWVLN
jgi:hypothetical protein